MILLTDPLWISLLLLSSARAKSLYLDTLLLPADKPVWIYFFGRFSGMKKAALEILSRICDFFFFSLNSIKWVGRWPALLIYRLEMPQVLPVENRAPNLTKQLTQEVSKALANK